MFHSLGLASLKAVHCISGRRGVFPQTFLGELSWVIGKSKVFSFCEYVKIIFLEVKTIMAGGRMDLSVAGTEGCPNWEARCSETAERSREML